MTWSVGPGVCLRLGVSRVCVCVSGVHYMKQVTQVIKCQGALIKPRMETSEECNDSEVGPMLFQLYDLIEVPILISYRECISGWAYSIG